VAERDVSVRSSVGPCILNGKISAITTFGKIDTKKQRQGPLKASRLSSPALFVSVEIESAGAESRQDAQED
jgi:hypothetical protein